MPKKEKQGRYLICIVRKNGDFYRYDMTDDLDETFKIYFDYLDMDATRPFTKTVFKNRIETDGIANYNNSKAFVIDLNKDESEIRIENDLKKFKRIKRLYGIKKMDI
jgi:hypothetical protein